MIGHINVNSLSKKTTDIQFLLEKHGHLQILGITETRLKSQHDNNILNIPHYTFFRKDASKKLHTGIGAYVHESLLPYVKRRQDFEHTNVETIWLELKPQNDPPVYICFLYRNGKCQDTWFDDFEEMLHKVQSINHNIILMGDFNINMAPENSNNDMYKKWRIFTEMFGLKQIIKEYTRVEKLGNRITSTLIDHIYVNCESIIERSFISHHSISDHKAIICSISYDLPKRSKMSHKYITYRSFKNFSQINFINDLSMLNLSPILMCADPNEAANLFLAALLTIINKHAPIKRKRVKYQIRPAWLTQEIKDEMLIRDKLKKDKKFDLYKKQRNKVLSLVRKAKRKYFETLTSNPNSKTYSIWKAINEFTKKSAKQTSTDTSAFKLDEINQYFITLSNSILPSTSKDYNVPKYLTEYINSKANENEKPFEIPTLSTIEVFKLVHKLKNKKTMDIYDMNTFLMKLIVSHNETLIALTHVYNLSILNETFPDIFKKAKVIPIPKTKNNDSLDNFRPISILPILSKPLETHINAHLSNFFENNNLLVENQSGFRTNHSCTSALINICDSWLKAINDKKIVGSVFLDLRKAFDLVDHSILIKKLETYLGDSMSTHIFSSYLSNRYQQVYVNSKYSKMGKITSGVPQGSILGPLLFSIFINDLPFSLTCPFAIIDLFADDSTLHTSDTSVSKINSTLQKSIDDIYNWCLDNNMALHPKKTKSMLITTRQKRQLGSLNLSLNINGNIISQVRSHKLLGIVIDDEFSWTYHIDYISSKLCKNVYLLSQLKHFVSTKALFLFYHAHCMSLINYSSPLWSKACITTLNRINTLHRRAVKLLSKENTVSTGNNTDLKFIKLNILNLNNQHILSSAILMYKIFHGDSPHYLQRLFTLHDNRIGLRAPNYVLPNARIDLYKKSFAFNGATIWNALPAKIRYQPTISRFKNETKNFLLLKQTKEVL